MTQRRRPRRPKIVLVRFFLSLRFWASIFDHFLSDLGLILGGFGMPKSIIFGIEISWIFACRSKSGPRAAMGGPRAAKGGTRAARRGPRATKSGPRVAKSGSCCRARCRTKDVTSRRHRPLGLYNKKPTRIKPHS